MRLLFRLLIVLVICLVATALPAAPARAEGPSIGLSPSSGMPGKEITVTGSCFTANHLVDIYYDGILVDLYVNGSYSDGVMTDEIGDFEADFTVPESDKGGHVVLADEYGTTVSASTGFTVKPGLVVSPEDGPVGTNVTVKGLGFAEYEEGIEVYFDDELVPANVPPAGKYGSWEMSFLIPTCAQGSHQIDAGGDSSNPTGVQDAIFVVAPKIEIVDPSDTPIEEPFGSPGESITMIGSGFAADERDIKILFDGEETDTDPDSVKADDTGRWEAAFEVPQRPKGTYGVTAKGEWTLKEDVIDLSFEIGPGLALFPNTGHVGTELTITGGGFVANRNIVIKYDDTQIATAKTGPSGKFEVGLVAPESEHGKHPMTAEDAAGNNATAFFTMESDAPDKPELISPPDGERTGFIGRMKLTFNWSEVEDLSGVYYSLQIATSDNLTDTGFADPVRSISNIVGTNYTLNDIEALPQGSYYWSVQAVDGAENKGEWAEPRSVRVGVMPLWAFVVLMVVAAGGIGTLVYFRWIKQRIYYY